MGLLTLLFTLPENNHGSETPPEHCHPRGYAINVTTILSGSV